MRIAPMSLADLDRVLDWAAAEGWNPGLDDAAAFHAADPDGFLMGWVGDEPVAAISVVRHNPSYGFLGLFITRPEWRGQGVGGKLWQAGMDHLGDRIVGLDGVLAQQGNYARAGFALAHRTIRFAASAPPDPWPPARRVEPRMLPDLVGLDTFVSGEERADYLGAWFTDTPTRRTLALVDSGEITGVGTIRACREGYKVGPLIAPKVAEAASLLRALAAAIGTRSVLIDMPEANPAALAMAEHLGFKPMFETARMYKGAPPLGKPAAIFGETTLELG
ncbi:GNAT family N-acetyltransferase [uncultured Amaricoccus sp.]|uniref:GNAT family N-acetyltransferase n=1 Tax=uncultured Amaricoccus sp. TaxID=339341 RepID=UPI002607B2AC|nr:GNAT family N-acetyltransferase [uncultured Amaricoccus sp.]